MSIWVCKIKINFHEEGRKMVTKTQCDCRCSFWFIRSKKNCFIDIDMFICFFTSSVCPHEAQSGYYFSYVRRRRIKQYHYHHLFAIKPHKSYCAKIWENRMIHQECGKPKKYWRFRKTQFHLLTCSLIYLSQLKSNLLKFSSWMCKIMDIFYLLLD